jgi:nucleotide-binding universal stress UspA family protein
MTRASGGAIAVALKNLLLHIDHTKGCKGRIDAAVALAAEHGAHLKALYCIPVYHVPGWADWPAQVPAGEASRDARDDDEAREALGEFTRRAEAAGISHEEHAVRVPSEILADEIAVHARYTDLAILGQVDPDEPPPAGRHAIEHVLLTCGRPVLVIPYIGPVRRNGEVSCGRDILVAWDAGREATRAVNDALPFLERAQRTELVTINPVRGAHHHGDEPGADIALQLSRHGARVEVKHLEARDLEVGDILLSELSNANSDLLVMGGYAHSRVRELFLGGVTRSILEHMPVPVLMSH